MPHTLGIAITIGDDRQIEKRWGLLDDDRRKISNDRQIAYLIVEVMYFPKVRFTYITFTRLMQYYSINKQAEGVKEIDQIPQLLEVDRYQNEN